VVTANGVVEPWEREVHVAGARPGVVTRVHVAVGRFVHANEPLVDLESSAERAALAAAEADLAVAEADLARTRHGPRREELTATEAEASLARARAQQADRDRSRTERAAAAGATSTSEIEQARARAEVERYAAEGALARHRILAHGARREDLTMLRARCDAARARRDQTRTLVEQLTVRAPGEGEVLEVHFREGEFYSPEGGVPLVVMGDTRRMQARVTLDERDVGRVRPGAHAEVTADGFPGRVFQGRVSRVGRRVSTAGATRTLEARVDLDDGSSLVSGLRVLVAIEP
jgi:multidrug resistance efflux pump